MPRRLIRYSEGRWSSLIPANGPQRFFGTLRDDVSGSFVLGGLGGTTVAVETLEVASDVVNVDILRLLDSKRYSARGATFVNTIFVDDRHLSAPGPLTSALRSKT